MQAQWELSSGRGGLLLLEAPFSGGEFGQTGVLWAVLSTGIEMLDKQWCSCW